MTVPIAVSLAPAASSLREAVSWRTGIDALQVFEHHLRRDQSYQGLHVSRADEPTFLFG